MEDPVEHDTIGHRHLGRRHFVISTGLSVVAAGCGTVIAPDGTPPRPDSSVPDGASPDGGMTAETLMWASIPSLVFVVGEPVDLDLRAYLTDASGASTITLNMPLPAGLSFDNGRISGTPSDEASVDGLIATADDGL
ncbi:MAG: putative Ig domain-containing protein [Myxococcota bacterium]